ncbi:MAG: CBS domain-containing protein [Candidatus Micrarchaeaceae archaeon]
MESLDEVSHLIKSKRNALGISQERLARYVRISQSAVARLESDIHKLNPSYETVYRVLSTLDRLTSIDSKSRALVKTAEQIMQKRIVYARPEDHVRQAIRLIQDYDFPQLPVIGKDMRIYGAVSRKALMKVATESPQMIDRLQVSNVVDEELPRVGRLTELGKIKKILEAWDAVLVVEKDKAIGIVTIYDVLKQI